MLRVLSVLQYYEESFGSNKRYHKKNAQRAVLVADAFMIRFLFKKKMLREYIMDLPGPAFNLSRLFTTTFEFRVIDRSVFCHLSPRPVAPQSLSHNLQRHRSPSRRPARGCVSLFLCPA